MQDSKELAQRVAREIAASSKTSQTLPGQSEKKSVNQQSDHASESPGEARSKADPGHVEAINQVFALFRLNYHNQYYAAFSEAEQLRQIKKLWLDSLHDYPAAQILQGAKLAIESSEYLPTLHRIRSCCDDSLPALGFPAPRDAYREACNSGSPPESTAWSHPVVYWAGRDCGWAMLASAKEAQSWPLFNQALQKRCASVLRGEKLPPIPAPPARAIAAEALRGKDAVAAMRKLRSENGL